MLSWVAELLDPVTGSWDHMLVRDIFWEQDAQEILRIPVNPDMEDLLAWHFDNKGFFFWLSQPTELFWRNKRIEAEEEHQGLAKIVEGRKRYGKSYGS